MLSFRPMTDDVHSIEILVADDDDTARRAIVSSLRELGYGCREARDGTEAIAELARAKTHIVLTDWNMPGATGLEVCIHAKRRPQPPHVILMTAFDARSRLIEGLRAGADDFIRKPIDLDELEVRVLAAARLVHVQRALARRNDELYRASESESRAARTDPLTALANRRRLDEDLARTIEDARRYGPPHCIAMCDVDYFKAYNDRFGHLAGDVALQQIAVVLREGVRAVDGVYRYGGEEFLLLFPRQGMAHVAAAMERLRASVEALAIPHAPVSDAGVLTMSVGVAELAIDETREEWLARADAALYRAKTDGRNRVALASTDPAPAPAPSGADGKTSATEVRPAVRAMDT